MYSRINPASRITEGARIQKAHTIREGHRKAPIPPQHPPQVDRGRRSASQLHQVLGGFTPGQVDDQPRRLSDRRITLG